MSTYRLYEGVRTAPTSGKSLPFVLRRPLDPSRGQTSQSDKRQRRGHERRSRRLVSKTAYRAAITRGLSVDEAKQELSLARKKTIRETGDREYARQIARGARTQARAELLKGQHHAAE